jgi:colanic acid/amylovoran biosynthesis protein
VESINQIAADKQGLVPFNPWAVNNIAVPYSLLGVYLRKHLGVSLPCLDSILENLDLHHYEKPDLIVSTGGAFLNGTYAPANWGRYICFAFAKAWDIPVILFAQSIGPYQGGFSEWIAAYTLNRVQLITLRDEQSRANLERIGVGVPPIHVTADAAFLLSTNNDDLLSPFGNETPSFPANDKVKISISVRRWPHCNGVKSHENYVNTLAALTEWLISEKNARVYFVSTCTGLAGYHMDDRIVACEILEKISSSPEDRPVILSDEYTPYQLAEIYREMDLHIGTRMHSNILAALVGTPIFAIQYEFKTGELMRRLGLEEFFVDLSSITYDDTRGKIDLALQSLESTKRLLADRVPGIKREAEETGRVISDFFIDLANRAK